MPLRWAGRNWMKQTTIKNPFIAVVSGLVFAFSAFVSLAVVSPQVSAAVDNTPDCDNVAIIKCGAFSESALKAAYDKNDYGDLKKVYDAFGISRSEMSGMENGIVWQDGRVTVDGKTVATGATTAGRNYGGTPISGTKNVGKYSTSKFVDEGQTAFVKMVDGKFAFAIVKACGNPVNATPKTPPKPVTPSYECNSLTQKKISRSEYQFTAKGSADNGAKVTGYRFTFGDGTTQTTSSSTIKHTYAKEGSYTVKVETRVTVDGETKYKSGGDCDVKITVTPPPAPQQTEVCNPKTGETITVDEKNADKYVPVGDKACGETEVCNPANGEIITVKESEADNYKPVGDEACEEEQVVTPPAPVEIAKTGPGSLVLGGLGLGSLTAAGYYFQASRRNLISKFLQK